MLGLYCCLDFPLVAASQRYSLGVMQGLLEWNREASAVAAPDSNPGPIVVAHGLAAPACGISHQDRACLFHWQMDFYYQGNPAFRPFKLQLPGLCLGLQETCLPFITAPCQQTGFTVNMFWLVTFWGQKLCRTCSVPYPQNLKWCLTIEIFTESINVSMYLWMNEWMELLKHPTQDNTVH